MRHTLNDGGVMNGYKRKEEASASPQRRNYGLTRRSFIKATAVTGTSLALGGALKPSLKALAQTGSSSTGEIGKSGVAQSGGGDLL